MKKTIAMLLTAAISASMLAGCGSASQPDTNTQAESGATAAGDTSSGAAAGDSAAISGDTSGAAAGNTSGGDNGGNTSSQASPQADSGASYTVGIGQFAEHGSLDNCREGFLAGLSEAGIVEGKNLTILYENAQADGGTASQIATNFAGKDVNLMCGIATPMAQAEYGVAKKSGIPVIFTAVTDPFAAGLAKKDGTPVGEITGTSDKLPVEKQLKMIREILPEAKTIGIMYTTSEVNSESAIAEYKKMAPDYGFKIVEAGISSSADIALAADSLLSKVDCLTNLTDNTVVASLPVILDKAAAKNIPVFGSEIEQVKIGCVAAMGLDYIQLGKQTGKMAAQVLKGEKKASEMNFETIKEAAFYGNTKVAGNLGITLPEDLTSHAADLFSNITQ